MDSLQTNNKDKASGETTEQKVPIDEVAALKQIIQLLIELGWKSIEITTMKTCEGSRWNVEVVRSGDMRLRV